MSRSSRCRVQSSYKGRQSSLTRLAAPLSGNQLTNDRRHRYTEQRLPGGVISKGLSSTSCDQSEFVARGTYIHFFLPFYIICPAGPFSWKCKVPKFAKMGTDIWAPWPFSWKYNVMTIYMNLVSVYTMKMVRVFLLTIFMKFVSGISCLTKNA